MDLYIVTYGEVYAQVVNENAEKVNEMLREGICPTVIHNELLGQKYVDKLKELK